MEVHATRVVIWDVPTAIECGAPNALLRRGWNKTSLPVGSEIVVDGYRAKNGSATIVSLLCTVPERSMLTI